MLQTSIELHDNFSVTLHNVIESVNLSVKAMESLNKSVNDPLDAQKFNNIRDSLNQATIDAQALDNAFKQIRSTHIDPPRFGDINWVSPNFEVFTNSGIKRFNSELASASSLLSQMHEQQHRLSSTAAQMDILPDNMISDITSVQSRIDGIKSKIVALNKIPFWKVNESTNAQLETLRSKLAEILSEQQSLNDAVSDMDFDSANKSYMRLSNTMNGTEQYIRDNIDGQDKFNRKIQDGQNHFSKLTGLIKGAVGAYLGIQGIKNTLNISDTLTSTTARLNLMNDGRQDIETLQNMIYASAERSRGAFQETADAVSKLGLMAGDAFNSSAEIIAFTEQLNKQFTIAGTEASGISAAMLQLTQAMGSGVLRGEEFNSIMEQAPNIIATIADYMGVAKGDLKALAGEGKVTANIVKNALLSVDAVAKTNAQFESMPKTFAQIGTSIKNTALMAFKPINDRLSQLANSDTFTSLVNSINMAIIAVSKSLVWIYDLIAPIGQFIVDNWSVISPLVYGVAAALGILAGTLIAYKLATIASTIAQWALNSAILACPITWIILAIIGVIVVIFMAANAIAEFTGLASNGFALICGGINVAIQFFLNLFKTVLNIGLGISNVVFALGHNIQTAFGNSIANVQSFFYNLLSTALNVIASIAEQLNKLPFISFDFSGITSQANDYANKAAALQANKGEYKSLTDAFNSGFNTFETFKDGWDSDAFNSGSAWGDSVTNKLSGLLNGFNNPVLNTDGLNIPDIGGIENSLDNIGQGVGDTAGNTGSIKDLLDVSSEDLKYLRDLAERDVINRFTTAEIKVNMGGITNNVNSSMDLDGIIDKLTTGVNEAMERAAEGVHV